MKPSKPAHPLVAVTGMGIVCSAANNLESFEAALRGGLTGIRPAGLGDGGPSFAAPIRGFGLADALSSRKWLPAELLTKAERATRRAPLAIQVSTASALEAWEAAALAVRPVALERVSLVVAGNNLTGGYTDSLRSTHDQSPSHLPARFALHVQDTDQVGTLSEILLVRGEGFTTGGASASGNLAIINACRLLQAGAADVCVVVGAMADLSEMEIRGFINIGAMVPDGPPTTGRVPAPFDVDRRGFIPGQAAACLILETMGSAAGRGANILAEINGYAIRLDGSRLANSSADGETAAMMAAIEQSGVSPRGVNYVNAHGSGSVLGDQTEVDALQRVFGVSHQPWVNSTKSLTGHCLSAAGVVEAVATVLQIRRGFVHPNVGLARPLSEQCRLVGATSVPTRIVGALSNSFGFGGINSSVLLQPPEGHLEAAT